LNWTHQLPDCAGDVNLLGQNLNTVKNTGEALLATTSQSCKIKVYVHVFLTECRTKSQNLGKHNKVPLFGNSMDKLKFYA